MNIRSGVAACLMILATLGRVASAEDGAVEERYLRIRAHAAIEDGPSDTKWLVLPHPEGGEVRIAFGWRTPRLALPEGILDFGVWQTRQLGLRTEGGPIASWRFSIDRIADDRRTLLDEAICPIHRRRMERADLPIIYGLLATPPEAEKEWAGGPGWVAGGCVVMEDKTTRGYRCEKCAAAYKRWREAERRRSERRAAEGS